MQKVNKSNFWDNTSKEGDCIVWMGRTDAAGYGRFFYADKEQGAHRVALLLSGVPVWPGAVVRHSCDNPRCVNPEHLTTGTQADNVADRVTRNRSASGERHGRAKLTSKAVTEIMAAAGMGERKAVLARRYGVTPRAIAFIVDGTNWKPA